MKILRGLTVACVVLFCAAGSSLFADASVSDSVMAPEGRWLGCTLSPHGVHVAALGMKGSRFAVIVDGVEGPRIDQLLSPEGSPVMTGGPDQVFQATSPVLGVFSDTGEHFAYLAKMGTDCVLFLDSKEIWRGPISDTMTRRGLTFSAGGKHLFLRETDNNSGDRMIVDGNPGPWSHTLSPIAMSADGAHYAYSGEQPNGSGAKWTVVDGRQVNYLGHDLTFTATGALVSVFDGKNGSALVINGKAAMQAASISRMWVSPVGGLVVAVVTPAPGAPSVLTVNGKAVPGTSGATINDVYFSPDGKRYAAKCSAAGGSFVVVDGKKGLDYQQVMESRDWAAQMIGFTPDSSEFYYVAQSSQFFLVVNEEESDGYPAAMKPVVGGAKRIGFIANMGAIGFVVIDGNATKSPGPADLGFSPDGSRHAYLVNSPRSLVCVDDNVQTGIMQTPFTRTSEPQSANLDYLFSPDSRHIAYAGYMAADSAKRGMIVDGALVGNPKAGLVITHPMFTPDSKHLFWVEPDEANGANNANNAWLVVDGVRTSKFTIAPPLDSDPGNWQMSPEGVLTFVAASDGEFKRISVTPPADTNVETMLAAGSGSPASASTVASTPPAPAAAVAAAPAPATPTASFKPVVKSPPQMAARVTEVAETPAEAKAAAEKLTWIELAQRPELWPAAVTVKVPMDFQGGMSVRAGQTAKLLQIKPQEADLVTMDGKLNFAADPDETDALALARDGYAKLTPRQRKITFGSLVSSKELWPYKVKLTQSFDFGNGKGVHAGDEVTVLDFQAGRLTVRSDALNGNFQVVPQATDIMAQARKFVEDDSAGPRFAAVQKAADDAKRAADERARLRGRVVAELDGRLVSSVTDKPEPLDEAALPKFLVFFRGSTTCPITRGFMPSVVKFYKQEKPKHPEFEVVWIETDSPEDTGKFAREEGFSWRAVEYDSTPYVPTVNNLIDGRLPQFIVMDRDGHVLANGIQNNAPAALNQLAALLK